MTVELIVNQPHEHVRTCIQQEKAVSSAALLPKKKKIFNQARYENHAFTIYTLSRLTFASLQLA